LKWLNWREQAYRHRFRAAFLYLGMATMGGILLAVGQVEAGIGLFIGGFLAALATFLAALLASRP
jgi:hypothetical protein